MDIVNAPYRTRHLLCIRSAHHPAALMLCSHLTLQHMAGWWYKYLSFEIKRQRHDSSPGSKAEQVRDICSRSQAWRRYTNRPRLGDGHARMKIFFTAAGLWRFVWPGSGDLFNSAPDHRGVAEDDQSDASRQVIVRGDSCRAAEDEALEQRGV